jgi:hypothetical protein
MTSQEILNLIFSFLGGGLVVGILDWLRSSISEKTSRRIQDLQDQIRHLYGPLYFFTSQNENLFKLNKNFNEAYTAEYSSKEWSDDEHTQKTLDKETSNTLDIANEYIEIVKNNNEKVISILTEKYTFIDHEDVEVFQRFVVDHTRLKTEISENGKRTIPLRIYRRIGDISIMRPEFMERVENKFHQKRNELINYQMSWFKRHS